MDCISWNKVFDALRNGDDIPFGRAVQEAVRRHPRIRRKRVIDLFRNYGVEPVDIVQELAVKVLRDRVLMQARLYSVPDYVLGERINRVLENLLIDQARRWRGRLALYDNVHHRLGDTSDSENETPHVDELIGPYVLSASRSTEDDYISKLTHDHALICLTDRQRILFEKYEGFAGDMTVLEMTRLLGVKKSLIYEEINNVKERLSEFVEE